MWALTRHYINQLPEDQGFILDYCTFISLWFKCNKKLDLLGSNCSLLETTWSKPIALQDFIHWFVATNQSIYTTIHPPGVVGKSSIVDKTWFRGAFIIKKRENCGLFPKWGGGGQKTNKKVWNSNSDIWKPMGGSRFFKKVWIISYFQTPS